MDRSIPIFNRYLFEKWQNSDLSHHRSRLQEINNSSFSTSIPSQMDHLHKYAQMKGIYNHHSRKQQLSLDRKKEIEKRNQELYAKMSVIFKHGGGHVAPL